MRTFRISKTKYAGTLTASGRANRWNRDNQFVIYTAESRALACLELAVHLDRTSILSDFAITVIEIPNELGLTHFSNEGLPKVWWKRSTYFELSLIHI